MVVINSIMKGIVIDHITAGRGLKVLEYLNVDITKNTVAFIMNASSKKYGSKDIIKIENVIDVDLTVLGLIEPNATVNIIHDHIIIEKLKLKLPEKVLDIIKCKNPRCVTSIEANAPHIFLLVDELQGEYSCEYCDDLVSMKGENNNEIIHSKWVNH